MENNKQKKYSLFCIRNKNSLQTFSLYNLRSTQRFLTDQRFVTNPCKARSFRKESCVTKGQKFELEFCNWRYNVKDLKKILESLKKINQTKKKDFLWYKRKIKDLFKIEKKKNSTSTYKYFLAGFIAGEGSFNVSAKKTKGGKYGVSFDPEFSVTQHLEKVEYLYYFLSLFHTGRIVYKIGSKATLVYRISDRKNISEKVIPFIEKYLSPYQGESDLKRFHLFKKLVYLLLEKKHLNLDFFKYQIIPLYHKLRKQIGQSNQTFTDLKDIYLFVDNFIKEKHSSSLTLSFSEAEKRSDKGISSKKG